MVPFFNQERVRVLFIEDHDAFCHQKLVPERAEPSMQRCVPSEARLNAVPGRVEASDGNHSMLQRVDDDEQVVP